MFKVFKEAEDRFMSNIRPHVKERFDSGGEISLEEYRDMRLNSYEAKYIHPLLSNDALIYRIETSIQNCFVPSGAYILPTTYDDYICTDGITELLKRFKTLS